MGVELFLGPWIILSLKHVAVLEPESEGETAGWPLIGD